MAKKTKPKREVKSVAAEIIEGLKELETALASGEPIAELFTVRRVKLVLKPQAYNAKSVKISRHRIGVSQALFAQLLGVSLNLVQSWEQGTRKPNPMACRLLDEMNLDPQRWKNRLLEAVQA